MNCLQGVCKMPKQNQLLGLQENVIRSTRPLCFAAVKIHRQQLHTPWTIMASGLAKCIEVYMAVLAIRCALGYFPNVEWNCQPYSGLRDICDPFLLLFQNIIPPVFDSLDLSLSVGFLVLTVLVEILTLRPF
ncbi:YlmG protein 1-2, chloroplastic [Heracleum sosnowskyi]|uniref:YlmG protein 1-2, chloroplastic n=1 Tax=Heracleum sosnowskyi TaxID=360622 RepID=A0AAD8ICY0_9APIA|nr:YlmG protein 1-2, chloroplastic [Heracleum sosnowskyi]